MTSSHVVCLLVLLISVAASRVNFTWNPKNCLQEMFHCKCELLRDIKTMTCVNQNLNLTPVNGFDLADGTQVADLSNNVFYALRDYAFNQDLPHNKKLAELLVLNISRNEIHNISQHAFKFMDKMTILDLSYNKIDQLSPLTFQNNSNLRELYLHHNLIETLEKFTFKKQTNLKVLDLSYCRLSKISWWALFFSNKPILLNLEHNKLRTFHSNYIYSPNIFSGGINLFNNPIQCDCDLHRFYQDTYGDIGRINLTCSDPTNRGRSLASLQPTDFKRCHWNFLLPTLNSTVETIASTTTVLTCHTIPGPLFKNWTIVSKKDGHDVTDWPDRYEETVSTTWVNLTINNTQKSDEGQYMCAIYERDKRSLRSVYHTVTLVVKELDVSSLAMEGTGQANNGTVGAGGGSSGKVWLVLSIAGFLGAFFVIVVGIFLSYRLRSAHRVTECTAEPLARDSHVYEDVDAVLIQLSQRTLPKPPKHEYATVNAAPASSSQYLQHCMAFQSPFLRPPLPTPIPSASSNRCEEGNTGGSYDNEEYLNSVSSPTINHISLQEDNNLKYIAILPTYH